MIFQRGKKTMNYSAQFDRKQWRYETETTIISNSFSNINMSVCFKLAILSF